MVHAYMAGRRRRLLKGMAGALLLPAMAAVHAAAPVQLNVMTSYPDSVMSRFEAAFEQQYPQYRIRFLWRMPHDALPYLEKQSGLDTADVYWAASPRTFARLKEQQLLDKLAIDTAGLPARMGKTQISDPDGYYLATEVAGYALALNEARLAQLGVAAPGDWHELANPRLLDQIALPVPGDVGFAPVMYDIVLQAYGWQRGWAIWSEVAALSRLVRKGAGFIGELVAPGDVAIGLSIDFFINAAVANGAQLAVRYPLHNGINPGHVAVLKAGHNRAAAQAFAAFVLSDEGQRLLAQRDIRKLPVRPAAYVGAAAPVYNPYKAAGNGTLNYDGERGRGRLNVISAIFEQMLAQPHDEVRSLWRRVHAAEAAGKRVEAVRGLLAAPPVDEMSADGASLQAQFKGALEGGKAPVADIVREWNERCARRRREAAALLDRMDA